MTIEQFVARAARLYEQEPEEAFASTRLGMYVRRWLSWAGAGIIAGKLEVRASLSIIPAPC